MKSFQDFVQDKKYDDLAEALVYLGADAEGLCNYVVKAMQTDGELKEEFIYNEFLGNMFRGVRDAWNAGRGMAAGVAGTAAGDVAGALAKPYQAVRGYGSRLASAGAARRDERVRQGQIQAAKNHVLQMGMEFKRMGLNAAKVDDVVGKLQAWVDRQIGKLQNQQPQQQPSPQQQQPAPTPQTATA